MVERARAAGMRMVGPNSQGLANFGTGAVLSFSTMFIETEPKDGPVGVISQSGAMSVVPYALLRARGLGVRHVHATGNDADVTVSELAGVVAEDPELRLLLLYLETDPRSLESGAARPDRPRAGPAQWWRSSRAVPPPARRLRARTPGRSPTRTGWWTPSSSSMGIWRARDVNELVSAAELYLKGWKPKGRRLVAISNSGAICVMAADAATQAGMPLAEARR